MKLTILGPALNGENIAGFAVNLAIRSGCIQRSGSKASASSPHNAGLRCVSRGRYTIGVFAGMYKGRESGCGYVGSEGGKTHGDERVSRTFKGTGGKRRSVSFITARTDFQSVRQVGY